MSVIAQYNGTQINDLARWQFQGSSNPLTFEFPNCTGALLKPSGKSTRTISLISKRMPVASKTAIEALQHDLNEFLICSGNSTLVIDGISYPNVTPLGVNQEVLTSKEYMAYSINFEIDSNQNVFTPPLIDGRVRDGSFGGYGGQCNTFPFFDNFEAGMDVSYGKRVYPRIPGSDGLRQVPVHGVESIKVDCWMVEQTTKNMQMYMADFLIDPLGKQGTLNLNGNIYNDAILVNVSSDDYVAQSMRYSLEFAATLAC